MEIKTYYNSLSTKTKLLYAAGLLLLTFLVFSYFSGLFDGFHDRRFDKNISKIEKQNEDLTNQYNEIKKENQLLRDERLKLDAQVQIFKQKESEIPVSVKKEQDKLSVALQELDKEQSGIANPSSDFQRCNDLNSRANFKYKLNCEEYK